MPPSAAALATALALLAQLSPAHGGDHDCGSSGKLVMAKIEGCDLAPCQVQRGKNITVAIRFRTARTAEVLRPEVVGVISDFEVPLTDLDHTDGCNRLSEGVCPVLTGEEVQYTTNLLLERDFPKIKGEVRWRLADQTNATVVCVSVMAEAV